MRSEARPAGTDFAASGMMARWVMLALMTVGAGPFGFDDLDSVEPVRAAGHVRGRGRQVALVEVQDGVRLELEAGLFFVWMRDAAKKDGVSLRIRSGFRTFLEQERLYECFIECSCNGCRRAAPPGFSPHESGRAVDLVVSDRRIRTWLSQNAERFGFVRTVRSEPWHFEFRRP